jgi:hypothetical protein
VLLFTSHSSKNQLISLSLACRDHLALPSQYHIANGVRASVAIAVQKGNALAIFGEYNRAVMHAG